MTFICPQVPPGPQFPHLLPQVPFSSLSLLTSQLKKLSNPATHSLTAHIYSFRISLQALKDLADVFAHVYPILPHPGPPECRF